MTCIISSGNSVSATPGAVQAMTSAEASVTFSERLEFRGGMEISAAGEKYLTIGMRYDW
jgi:hypothetical protein